MIDRFSRRPYLLDLRQLYYFVKVAEIGNFTKASQELNIVQPALGISIRKLEETLQVKLLERHSRGVGMTDHGRLLFAHAVEILDCAVQIQDAIAALTATKLSRFVVGMHPSMASLSVRLIQRHSTCPDLGPLEIVEANVDDIVSGLKNGSIDMACVYGAPPKREDILCELISSEDMLVVGPPAMMPIEGDEIDFEQLAKIPLVINRKRLLERLQSRADAAGISLRLLPGNASDNLCLEMAIASVAFTILPASLVQAKIEAGQLRGLHIAHPRLTTRLYLCGRKSATDSPMGKLVREWLQQSVTSSFATADPSLITEASCLAA